MFVDSGAHTRRAAQASPRLLFELLLFWDSRIRRSFDGRAATPDPHLSENHLERTESGERRLNKIESNEGSKPKPVRAVIVGQDQANEDETSRESANDHFHNVF